MALDLPAYAYVWWRQRQEFGRRSRTGQVQMVQQHMRASCRKGVHFRAFQIGFKRCWRRFKIAGLDIATAFAESASF